MINDEWDDEESDDDLWADDDELDDADDSASCPECGGRVYTLTDKCPSCGYWLTDADRRAMCPAESKPLWLRITAMIVLVAFLFTLLAVGFTLF
jgi:hypothetical protein